MDSTAFITGSEWTHNSGYSAGEGSTFAPTTGLFAPFPEGQSKDGLAEGTYGLFDGARDTSGYLHATPPAATPLRRARSLNINASPSLPARSGNDQLSSPSSPLSDALQTPRDGQQLNAGSSWFAVEQTSFLNSLAAASGGASSSQQQQQDSSSTLFASHLATPASDVTLRERRRCPSAQAALGSTSASSYQGSNLSLAIPDARSAAMAQQPSIEDVNQFFNDMSEILGPSAMSAISPPSAYPELPTSPVYSRPATAAPSYQAPTYQVNGVILSAEDYDLYTRSPLPNFQSSWPQSAPLSQTSFGARYDNQGLQHQVSRRSPPPAAHHRQQPSNFSFNPEYSTSSGHFNPSFAPPRPRSAPASPDLGSGGAFAPFSHDGSFNPPPSTAHAYYPLRRGSSAGAGAESQPRSFPPHPQGYEPYPQQPPSHHFHQEPLYQQQQRTPPHYGLSTPYYPPSSSAYGPSTPIYADYGPPSPSSSPSRHPQLRRMSSVPVGLSVNPRPVASRTGTSKRSAPSKGGAGGVSFINFSSSDATKLLSGVAPSGSSKRKRDEEEQRRQQQQQAKQQRVG